MSDAPDNEQLRPADSQHDRSDLHLGALVALFTIPQL